MGHMLRDGISFCDVSDRLLFLDIAADRYFCLGENAERAFRALIARHELSLAEACALRALKESGMLLETADARTPEPCQAGHVPDASLLDAPSRRIRLHHRLAAMTALAKARLSLRSRGLQAALDGLTAAKAPSRAAPETVPRPMHDVAAAFEWTARLVRSHDQCLTRSIAVARRLAALDLPADLVIGVRLRPFAAHCWVQSGGWLVNDRSDTVRTYTPILTV